MKKVYFLISIIFFYKIALSQDLQLKLVKDLRSSYEFSIFSPDNKFLVTAGATLNIFNFNNGSPILIKKISDYNKIKGMAFTPDGKWFVVAGVKRLDVYYVSEQNFYFVKRLNPEIDLINTLSISPDGNFLAVGGYDYYCLKYENKDKGIVKLYSISNGEFNEFYKIEDTEVNEVTSLAFSPENILAIGSQTKKNTYTIKAKLDIYSVSTNNVNLVNSERFNGKDEYYSVIIDQINFSRDGKFLSAKVDKNILVYSFTGNTIELIRSFSASWLGSSKFSEDGRWFYSDKNLYSLSNGSFSLVRSFDNFINLTFTSDGKWAAGCYKKKEKSGYTSILSIYSVQNGIFTVEKELKNKDYSAKKAIFSPDGKWLAIDKDTILDVFYLQNGNFVLKKSLKTIYDQNSKIIFSPDSRWLVKGAGQKIFVWSVWDGKFNKLSNMYEKLDYHQIFAFSPDSKWFAMGWKNEIYIYSVKEDHFEKLSRYFHNPQLMTFFSVAFSPDSKWLVIGAEESRSFNYIANLVFIKVNDGKFKIKKILKQDDVMFFSSVNFITAGSYNQYYLVASGEHTLNSYYSNVYFYFMTDEQIFKNPHIQYTGRYSEETKVMDKRVAVISRKDEDSYAIYNFINSTLKTEIPADEKCSLSLYPNSLYQAILMKDHCGYSNLGIYSYKIKKTNTSWGTLQSIDKLTLDKTLENSLYANYVTFSKDGKWMALAGHSGVMIYKVSLYREDLTPPKISVPSLENIFTVYNPEINITGTVKDTSGITLIKINNKRILHNDGNFSTDYTLEPGINIIHIEAEDSNGNISEKTYSIKYQAPTQDKTGPVITITYPQFSRGFVLISQKNTTIKGYLTDESPIKYVKINGIKAQLSGNSFSANIPLSQGSTIFIEASDIYNNITKKIIRIGEPETSSPVPSVQSASGNYYALIIGVSDYSDPDIPDLAGEPTKDAKKLADILKKYYEFSNVKLLLNPTYSDIVRALDNYKNTLKDNDNLLIFYAGHGYYDKEEDEGYWLPKDADNNYTDRWLYNSIIAKKMKAIKAKHILLITDACFSGSIFKTRAIQKTQAIEKKMQLKSRKAMTSGTLKTVPNKSVFFEYLAKYLIQNTDKYLPADELFKRIEGPVANNSPNLPQFGTIQNAGDEGGDFVFIHK